MSTRVISEGRPIVFLLPLAFMVAGVAAAQCPAFPYQLTNGQTADATAVMANFSSVAACATDATNITSGNLPSAQMSANLSTALDSALGSTQGSIAYRGPSGWLALGPGPSGYILSSNGPGANPSWTASGSGSGDYALVASVNVGSTNSFTITGLNTTVFDYKLSVRASRPASGAASSDYIQVQFGDATSPTPNLFTSPLYITALGTEAGSLATANGIAKVAQVQNNSTLYMGTTLDMQFSGDGLVVSGLGHSYFFENIVQFDQGPNSSPIGSIQITMPNQSWNITYSLWRIAR